MLTGGVPDGTPPAGLVAGASRTAQRAAAKAACEQQYLRVPGHSRNPRSDRGDGSVSYKIGKYASLWRIKQ
jgi:hypothetical protein